MYWNRTKPLLISGFGSSTNITDEHVYSNLSISGNGKVLAFCWYDSINQSSSKIWIYKRDSIQSDWSFVQLITNTSNLFGVWVSMSFDGSIIASYGNAVQFFDLNSNTGLYEKRQAFTVTGSFSSNASVKRAFHLSEDGSIFAISEGSGGSSVYIYQWNGSTFTQKGQTITHPNSWTWPEISLSGDGLTIGITHNPNYPPITLELARAYRFNENLNLWEQLGDTINSQINKYSGSSQRNTIHINSQGTLLSVCSYELSYEFCQTFQLTNNSWELVGNPITEEPFSVSRFGSLCQLSRNSGELFIGSDELSSVTGSITNGFLQKFNFNGSDWQRYSTPLAVFNSSDGEIEGFGERNRFSVSDDGKSIVVLSVGLFSNNTEFVIIRSFFEDSQACYLSLSSSGQDTHTIETNTKLFTIYYFKTMSCRYKISLSGTLEPHVKLLEESIYLISNPLTSKYLDITMSNMDNPSESYTNRYWLYIAESQEFNLVCKSTANDGCDLVNVNVLYCGVDAPSNISCNKISSDFGVDITELDELVDTNIE